MSSGLDTNPGQPHGAFTVKSQLLGCCIYFRLPFFIAVEEGDATEVAKFLQEDALWLKISDKKERRTAWHIAAAKGHVEVLRALVARTREDDVRLIWNLSPPMSSRIKAVATGRDAPGPDERVFVLVNSRATLGPTPLTLAAEHDHPEAVKYLLSVGADPWLGDYEGKNPAHYAARTGAIRSLQVLLEEEKPLTSRASNRNLPGTRYVDSLDTFGFSPLHYATWANRKSAMMLLIGFDANLITRSLILHDEYSDLPPGSTPLHIACLLGDLERVRLLLKAYYETAADLLPSQTAMLGTTERRRRARSHPDPRLILTRTQRLPFHIATRAGHRHLLDWLDPSVPLMFLFGGEEEMRGTSGGHDGILALVGVSRLTVIAAKALHQALLTSLDVAAEDIRRYEEEAEARRRRREERRLAREAKAAAQSLKQGKEPEPADSGIRGRIRRLIERASRDAAAAGAGTPSGATAGTAGVAVPKTGWRPWRSRTRNGRRKLTLSGQGDGVMAATAAAGLERNQSHGAVPRSPRRRRRRSTIGTVGQVTSAASLSGIAPMAARADGAAAAQDTVNGNNDDAAAGNSGLEQMQPSQADGSGILNSSLRLRVFRSSGSQRSQQQQQQQQAPAPQPPSSSPGRDANGAAADALEGPEATVASTAVGGSAANEDRGYGSTDGSGGGSGGGGGGLAASITRTMQRLYRGSLRRQSSGVASFDPTQAQLNERLSLAGITIPEGPDEAVAFFTPGREPRYNIPTQILLPAGGVFNASQRGSAVGPASPTPAYPTTRTVEDNPTAAATTFLSTAIDGGEAALEPTQQPTPATALSGERIDATTGIRATMDDYCRGRAAEALATETTEMEPVEAVSVGDGVGLEGSVAGAAEATTWGDAAPAVATSDRALVGSRSVSQMGSTSTLITELLSHRQDSDGVGSSSNGVDGANTYLAGQVCISGGRAAAVSNDCAASISAVLTAAASQATAAAAVGSPRSVETESNPDFRSHPAVSRSQDVVNLPPIRSAGTSRMPSLRTSVHLPGAASITAESESELPLPLALLPFPSLPPAGRPSGDGVAASNTANRSQLLEVVAVRQSSVHVNGAAISGGGGGDNDDVDAGNLTIAAVDGGDGTINTNSVQGLSLGIIRVGASARQLFNSLRDTLRGTSSRQLAEVVPIARSTPARSPGRAHRRIRHIRTPDSSARRSRTAGPSPAAAAVVAEDPATVAGTSAGGRDGTVPAAGIDPVRSPNTSHHRGSVHSHPHGSLAARGVRVASGWPHARVSLYSRLSGGTHPEAAGPGPAGSTHNASGAGATTRRRMPSQRSPAPSGEGGELPGQGAPTTDAGSDDTACGAAADAVAAVTAAPPPEDPVTAMMPAAPAAALSSSFSSTSSRERKSAALPNANDEDVCPVCLDEAPNLLVQTCRHQLCMDCARDLVKRHSLTPALCPYCRGIISGFKARVAAGQAAGRQS
ncbi:hypothetical protein Vretimale_11835 [Volvox reticuliferus]|uniref:RING-type domain-containing protein n=1 Tax=Volvox reticuliferus TaxID=1737510 RepID=A0A8J4GI73_9CHLO|nr:hypothetical protein Vretimale_11835 [Volvox reticuliferus]